MRLGLSRAVLLVAALCSCNKPHEEPPPAAKPAAPAYKRAALAIETQDIVAATLAWDAPVIAPADLAQAHGPVIVSFADGLLDQFDAGKGTGQYRGHGVLGLDTDPIVAFTESPTIENGEMAAGGHARFITGYIHGSIKTDEAGWKAFTTAEMTDPLTMQLLVEPRTAGTAHLAGVRVVRLGAHEVFLEGRPAHIGHPVL